MSEELTFFKFVVEGLLLVATGLVGCVGNILCIIWFCRKEVQKNFHQLMQTLACFDLMYILLSILMFGLPSIFPWIGNTPIFKWLLTRLLPLAQIGLTGSIYLTLAIAVERYTTVCHPFFKVYHGWSSTLYLVPIALFSVLYNLPKFFELEVYYLSQHSFASAVYERNMSSSLAGNLTYLPGSSQTGNLTYLPASLHDLLSAPHNLSVKIGPTALRIHPYYIQVYCIYLNLVIHGIIPLLLLTILNTAIYKQVRRLTADPEDQRRSLLHQREIRLSQVSLLIVIVFIICHSVRWVPNIYELLNKDNEWPAWIEYVTEMSHLLTTFNASVNYYIYIIKHSSPLPRSRPAGYSYQPSIMLNSGDLTHTTETTETLGI